MNQEKIGKFISLNRKKKNLTQEALANKLNISKNAVSKWERGLSLPDVSIMQELCEILDISLNELFAGHYIKEKDIENISNNNIINIVNASNKNKNKSKRIIIILIILVIINFIGIIYLKVKYTPKNTININWNLDIPSNLKEEYYTDSGASFHGDGKRYTVLKGTKFNKDFNTNKNSKLEREITNLYKELKIPSKEQINFNNKYSWKLITGEDDSRDKLYIVYDPIKNKYYFYEIFS